MNFDLSKENIQPLRGGRNATQLAAALQAQNDLDHQKDLILQKQEFEKIILNYVGPDPLENWFSYISWIEQSFPKHGHEGNLAKSLEECLGKFEKDPRYEQDPRLCKLFIKYFDMQPNPIESFQLIHQVGIGTECADLYKAWAYYHEANSDFKRAEQVFKLGFQANAQPHDDLENAHLSFLMAVGRHTVQGIQDPSQLTEKRRALTSLKSFKHKHRVVVPSQRTGSNVADYLPGVVKLDNARSSNQVKVEIFQDDGDSHAAGPSQVEVKPKSILDSVTKRETVHKENFMKAGTWNSARKGAAPSANSINFVVHQDENEQQPHLPKTPTAVTPPGPITDYFADHITELYIPEPNTAAKISQYNISAVYANQTEYSFEQLLAQRYFETRQQKKKEELHNYDLASNYMNPQFQTTPLKSKMSVLKLNSPAGFQELNGYDEKQKQVAATNLIQQFNYEVKQPNLVGNTLEEAAKAVESISEPKWQEPENLTSHTKEAMYEVNNLWADNQYSLMEPKVENFQILEDSPTYLLQQNDQPFQIYTEGPNDIYKNNQSNFKKNYYEYPQHQQQQQVAQQHQVVQQHQAAQQHHQYQQHPMQRQIHQQQMHHQYQNNYQQPVQHFQQHHQPPVRVPDFDETISTQTFNFNLVNASTPTHSRKPQQTYGAMPVHHYSPQPPQHHMSPQPQPPPQHISPHPIQNNYQKMMSPVNNYNLEQQHHNHHYQPQPSPHANHSSRQQLFPQYVQKVEPVVTTTLPNHQQQNYMQDNVRYQQQQHSARPQLSLILEENSKECGSSSSGGSSGGLTTLGITTLKTPGRDETMPKGVSQVSRDTCSMEYELGEALLQLGSQRYLTEQPKPPEVDIYVDQNSKHSTESLGGNSSYHSPKNEVEEVMDWDEHSNSMDYTIGCQSLSAILASDKPVDPFDSKVIDCLLKKARFPLARYSGFIKVQQIPKISPKETVYLKNDRFCIEKVLGKGTYGTVVKASNLADGSSVALKHQRPANFWEYYICQEIQHRIKDSVLLFSYMNISKIYFSKTASVFLYEFSKYGSLLNVANKVKEVTGKLMKDVVVYHFVNEMIRIISALHQCQIIHADIKPDNFLVMRLPPDSGRLSLQLIDFGCSIDMSLFPPDMCFYKAINTEDFTCTEMREGKPWTYQTDLYCMAASAYVLLMGEYMRVKKEDGLWTFTKRLPRYVSLEVWKPFFRQLLNIESCDSLPDLTTIASSFQCILNERHSDLSYELRNIANVMNGR